VGGDGDPAVDETETPTTMATISTPQLSIVRDVDNADITVTYTITWSAFDQLTNLAYNESWKLIGDDTAQDGDNLPLGDDPIPLGLMFFPLGGLKSNGQATTSRTLTKTIGWVDLNEDDNGGNLDDEIRAVVTLQPLLPETASRESAAVVVVAP
jgi:hypothetical protein